MAITITLNCNKHNFALNQSEVTKYSLVEIISHYLQKEFCSGICDETVEDIINLLKDSKKVSAIKLLRERAIYECYKYTISYEETVGILGKTNEFFNFLVDNYGYPDSTVIHRKLNLRKAKDIIDTICHLLNY